MLTKSEISFRAKKHSNLREQVIAAKKVYKEQCEKRNHEMKNFPAPETNDEKDFDLWYDKVEEIDNKYGIVAALKFYHEVRMMMFDNAEEIFKALFPTPFDQIKVLFISKNKIIHGDKLEDIILRMKI